MISEVVIPYRNARYRIFKLEDKHYILNLDRPILSVLLPFIMWFIPHTVYQVDKETYEKLKEPNKENIKKPTNKKTSAFWTVVLPIGFIGSLIGRVLAPKTEGLDGLLPSILTLVLLTFFLVIIVGLRIYVSKRIYKKVDKVVGKIDTLPKRKIKIRPKKISNYFMALFAYLLFGVFFIMGGLMSVDYNDIFLGLVSSGIGFMFLMLSMTLFFPPYYAKIKYIDNNHDDEKSIT